MKFYVVDENACKQIYFQFVKLNDFKFKTNIMNGKLKEKTLEVFFLTMLND